MAGGSDWDTGSGYRDAQPVTYGRWLEAHRNILDQVAALRTAHDRDITALRQQIAHGDAELEDRISQRVAEGVAVRQRKRDRSFAVMVTVLAAMLGTLLPLVIAALQALGAHH